MVYCMKEYGMSPQAVLKLPRTRRKRFCDAKRWKQRGGDELK